MLVSRFQLVDRLGALDYLSLPLTVECYSHALYACMHHTY